MGKKRVATVQEETDVENLEAKKAKKKKKSRMIARGNIYVRASYNNTTLTATDENGNVLAWSTAGSAGFKGPRKATPYAATQVVDLLLSKLENVDMQEVHILVRGIGSGRDSAVRALTGKGLKVTAIKDITPLPHNGCRPRKRRRG